MAFVALFGVIAFLKSSFLELNQVDINQKLNHLPKANTVANAVEVDLHSFNFFYYSLDTRLVCILLILGFGSFGLYYYTSLSAAAQCSLESTFGTTFTPNLAGHLGYNNVTPSLLTQQELIDAQIVALFTEIRKILESGESFNIVANVATSLQDFTSS